MKLFTIYIFAVALCFSAPSPRPASAFSACRPGCHYNRRSYGAVGRHPSHVLLTARVELNRCSSCIHSFQVCDFVCSTNHCRICRRITQCLLLCTRLSIPSFFIHLLIFMRYCLFEIDGKLNENNAY